MMTIETKKMKRKEKSLFKETTFGIQGIICPVLIHFVIIFITAFRQVQFKDIFNLNFSICFFLSSIKSVNSVTL